MKWYLRACPVCRGDLHEDIEDPGFVTCFLCGRAFRTKGEPSRLSDYRRSELGPESLRPAA